MIDANQIGARIQKVIAASDRLYEGVGVTALEIIRRAEFDLVQESRRNLRRQGAIDTGLTFQNIVPTEPRLTGEVVTGTVRAGGVAALIEYGRAPGRRMPPGGVLLDWMARHSIPRHAEFAVRRAIARRGIAPRPFMAPAGDTIQQRLTTRTPPPVTTLIRSVERGLR